VFLAHHASTGERLALKVLWPQFSQDEDEMQRFIRTMKSMYPVRHPNIVRIENAGRHGKHCWVAMECLTGRPPFEGHSLPEMIQRIREAEPVKPKQFQLSIADMFQDAVLKMLAKRPEDRYQTPTALLKDLERIGKYQGIAVD
jgi:serine/threonine protein kinase